LWDLDRASNPAFFMTALTVYKCTCTHAHVVQAVQEAFKRDGGASFTWWNTQERQQAQETLKNTLIQIAKNACLHMLHV